MPAASADQAQRRRKRTRRKRVRPSPVQATVQRALKANGIGMGGRAELAPLRAHARESPIVQGRALTETQAEKGAAGRMQRGPPALESPAVVTTSPKRASPVLLPAWTPFDGCGRGGL